MELWDTEKRNLRAEVIRLFTALGILLTFAIFICGNAGAETAADIVAPEGCAMAHCDPGLSDDTRLLAPLSGGVIGFWRDTTVNGSLVGLGCVANTQTAVCSFRSSSSKPAEIKAYAPDGTPLWSSAALSSQAHYSAPIIGPDGGVIAADQTRMIRFDGEGDVVWSQATAGGSPISPNVTDDGKIVLATKSGPVSAYDFESGELIAQISLSETLRVGGRMRTGIFDTINTPAIKGNRVYISTRFAYGYRSTNIGRLYALDLVEDAGGYGFEVAWYYEFRAPSGTSPTLGQDEADNTIIYFDGSGLTPASGNDPRAFAVKDLGSSAELMWTYPLSALPQSSPALDPREEGGIWYYAPGSSDLLRLDEIGGALIQTIDVNEIVDDDSGTFIPHSVMTISGDRTTPVMMVAAAAVGYSKAYIIAIDLDTSSLLWKYRVDEGRGFYGTPSGQYPLLINDSGRPVVVFSTRQNGVWGLVVGETPVEAEP